MAYSILISLLLLIAFTSCKKDKVPEPYEPCIVITENHTYDTILPSDYLMTYPGSWWEYSNGDIDSCIAWSEVIINESITSPDGCILTTEDIQILPHCHFKHYTYESTYYSFESRVFPNTDHTTTRHQKIIDTVPGHIYIYNTSNSSTASSTSHGLEVIEHLDSMIIEGTVYYDIIHVKEGWSFYYSLAPGGPSFDNEYYFSKNIGPIRKLIGYNSVSGPSDYDTLDLVNHYIEPY